ncbi:IS110 family transposase [Pseudonocardia alaniniphila]|uniref:IS110 family transposase n=2 Tax=Pseudonocardia alaniniphila TaxID=75291 RepID=A0ABS9THN2_9PSEU|nr:IS110 family transposase [Pseudonocardia alaniniphila]MCH6168044.1 IS110 family transposase [Pseudonocardia alaniniphila]
MRVVRIADGSSEGRPASLVIRAPRDPAREMTSTNSRPEVGEDLRVFCGIDWAERHHDIALIGQDGGLIAKRRINDGPDGFDELTAMLTAAGDSVEDSIPVAIETPRGLLVAALRATARPVFAINPMAVARYRERHSFARAKSDHADAMTLANILRTDSHAHRKMPADTDLAQAIAVLARAAQDAIWRRTRATLELRSLLREYYPGFLTAFARAGGSGVTNLAGSDARHVLALAPSPAAGTRISVARIAAALRRGGRKRGAHIRAAAIAQALHAPQLRQPPLIEQAMSRQALALLTTLNAECDNAEQLGQASIEAFRSHPDHTIITSFPGLGELTGARILGELGDDRARFTDARAVKAYAGSAPVTRASGRNTVIMRRQVKNNRLAAVGFVWAFATMARTGPPKDHYDQRRAHGDRHAAALRHLFNRMIGQLHHCLQTRRSYDPVKAFPERAPQPQPSPA